MSNPFHLAVPAGDLNVATKFYVDVLGCKLGNKEGDKWIDVDFWGNELTLHKTEMKFPNERFIFFYESNKVIAKPKRAVSKKIDLKSNSKNKKISKKIKKSIDPNSPFAVLEKLL